LFIPQDPFYRIAAEECVEAGIGINLFLFPSQYIDAATLGESCSSVLYSRNRRL
jgi:protein transport protein SEC24